MGEDPTPGEVSRALDMLREDVRDDIKDLRDLIRDNHRETSGRLNRAVGQDAYLADRQLDRERFTSISDRIRALEDREEKRADAIEQAKADRAANRKWIIASLIIPLGIAVVDLIFAIKGVK